MSSSIILNGFECSGSRFLHSNSHRNCPWAMNVTKSSSEGRLCYTPHSFHSIFTFRVDDILSVVHRYVVVLIVAISNTYRCRISTCLILLSIQEQCFLLLLVGYQWSCCSILYSEYETFCRFSTNTTSKYPLLFCDPTNVILALCKQTKIHQFSLCVIFTICPPMACGFSRSFAVQSSLM